MKSIATMMLSVGSLTAAADIYKCTDGNGMTFYREAPCHDGQRPAEIRGRIETLELPADPAGAGRTAAPEAAAMPVRTDEALDRALLMLRAGLPAAAAASELGLPENLFSTLLKTLHSHGFAPPRAETPLRVLLRALAELERALADLAAAAPHVGSALGQAQAAWRNGELGEAEEHLRQALLELRATGPCRLPHGEGNPIAAVDTALDSGDEAFAAEHLGQLLEGLDTCGDEEMKALKRTTRAALDQNDLLMARSMLAEALEKQTVAGATTPESGGSAARTEELLGKLAELELNYSKSAGHYAHAVLLTPSDDTRAKTRYLKDEAAALLRIGEHGKAREALERALSILQERLDLNPLEVAETLEALAGVHHAAGDDDPAVQRLLYALRIRHRLLGNVDPTLVDTLIQLAQIHSTNKQYEEAEALLEQAFLIARQQAPPDARQLSECLARRAGLMRQMGRYGEAQQTLEHQLELTVAMRGAAHGLPILSELAELFLEQHRVADAERIYRQAWEAAASLFGPESPETIAFKNKYRAQVLRRIRD